MSSMRSKKKTMRTLRFAIKKRKIEQVRDVLKLKPKLRTPEGGQMLWGVIDNPEIASMLVRSGADLCVRNPSNQSSFLLWLASRAKNEEYLHLALLMLERGANVNFRDNQGNTALHLAVQIESLALVEALVKSGLSVDITNADGETAICMAAKSSRAAGMLRSIVDQEPLDAKKRNRRLLDAVEYLICSDNDESVAIRALLNLNVDINESCDCGLTPLSLAVARGKSYLLELLMEFGSHTGNLMKDNNLPVIRASYLEQSLILRLLCERGDGVNAKDEHGSNPLHVVCACSKFVPLRNIQLLLHLGADVNVVDRWGNTPFALMDVESLSDARQLYIKHFALLFAKRAAVNDADMLIVQNDFRAKKFYGECLQELQKMKRTIVYNDISLFSFFVKSSQQLSLLAKNSDFVVSFNDKKIMFPLYMKDLENIFRIAEERRTVLRCKEEIVQIVTNGVLPSNVVEKIVYYTCLDELKVLHREYYFSLYARTNMLTR